jgi:hypothetical protein
VNIACADGGHHRAGEDRSNAGHAHQPFATGILARDGFDLVRQTFDPLIEPAPVAGQIFGNADVRGDRTSGGMARMRGSSARKTYSLTHGNAALEQEGADLIDYAGALADQPLPYLMQCLQVQLIGGLGRDDLHRGPLHRFGDCLRITEVILLALGIGRTYFADIRRAS